MHISVFCCASESGVERLISAISLQEYWQELLQGTGQQTPMLAWPAGETIYVINIVSCTKYYGI